MKKHLAILFLAAACSSCTKKEEAPAATTITREPTDTHRYIASVFTSSDGSYAIDHDDQLWYLDGARARRVEFDTTTQATRRARGEITTTTPPPPPPAPMDTFSIRSY